MTKEEKVHFRGETATRTLRFAADVHRLIQNVHVEESKNGARGITDSIPAQERSLAPSVMRGMQNLVLAVKDEPKREQVK